MPEMGYTVAHGRKELARAFSIALEQIRSTAPLVEHPLGFCMFPPMGATAHGGYSRLHVWHRQDALTQVPHSHSSNLRSTILVGRIRNNIWTVHQDEAADMPVVTIDKYGRTAPDYRALGELRLAVAASLEFQCGERYDVPAGVFHSNECLSDTCVTWVERAAGIRQPSQVAKPLADILAARRPPVSLSVAARTGIRDAILAAVEDLDLSLN